MERKSGIDKKDARLSLAHVYIGFIALLLGGTCGLLQVLVRSGKFELPKGIGYYQLLTAHGVLLALVLTTFLIIGFLLASMSKTSGTFGPKVRNTAWVGFWVMTIGTTLTTYSILTGKSSVLYTFYAPLYAHPFFYIGLTLVVVGSWISGFAMFGHLARWKKEHKGETTPTLSYMAVMTMVLWLVATLGIASAMLFQFIPWSIQLELGKEAEINVLLSRTLFWYFGHPLVYFWLLPAYMVWYAVIPKILGAKMFSDSLARLSFVLFLLFSIPVGFHHQLTEPGIGEFWKFLQVVLTMMVVIPSLMTAFAMFATFEGVGKKKGYKGLLGFFKVLPYGDVRFLAPFIGMLAFIPGGIGGIINASHQMNALIHNTIWVTGHFHLTVATTVLLTLFGMCYWLIPSLTGRVLTRQMNNLGVIQTIVWTVGMVIMSGSMHLQGLLSGAPRRSSYSEYGGSQQAVEWGWYQMAQAVGGTILFIGIIMILFIVINLLFFAPKGETEFIVAEMDEKAEKVPAILENFWLWIGVVVLLILAAYTIPVINMIQHAPPGSTGFKFF